MIRRAAFAVLCALCASPALAAGMALPPDGSSAKYELGPAILPKGALRVKFPPHAVAGPHAHPADENLTIFSGVLTHEMGEKLDKAAGEKVGSGDFAHLPGNMPYSTWTEDRPVEPQATGTGPCGLDCLDPADRRRG